MVSKERIEYLITVIYRHYFPKINAGVIERSAKQINEWQNTPLPENVVVFVKTALARKHLPRRSSGIEDEIQDIIDNLWFNYKFSVGIETGVRLLKNYLPNKSSIEEIKIASIKETARLTNKHDTKLPSGLNKLEVKYFLRRMYVRSFSKINSDTVDKFADSFKFTPITDVAKNFIKDLLLKKYLPDKSSPSNKGDKLEKIIKNAFFMNKYGVSSNDLSYFIKYLYGTIDKRHMEKWGQIPINYDIIIYAWKMTRLEKVELEQEKRKAIQGTKGEVTQGSLQDSIKAGAERGEDYIIQLAPDGVVTFFETPLKQQRMLAASNASGEDIKYKEWDTAFAPAVSNKTITTSAIATAIKFGMFKYATLPKEIRAAITEMLRNEDIPPNQDEIVQPPEGDITFINMPNKKLKQQGIASKNADDVKKGTPKYNQDDDKHKSTKMIKDIEKGTDVNMETKAIKTEEEHMINARSGTTKSTKNGDITFIGMLNKKFKEADKQKTTEPAIVYFKLDGKVQMNDVPIDFPKAKSEIESLGHGENNHYIGFINNNTKEMVQFAHHSQDSWYADVPIPRGKYWSGYVWGCNIDNTEDVIRVTKLFLDEASWFNAIPFTMRKVQNAARINCEKCNNTDLHTTIYTGMSGTGQVTLKCKKCNKEKIIIWG